MISAKSMIRNNITYLCLFLLIAATFCGYLLNGLGLHMAVKQVISQGIDYDAFREMKIEMQQIERIKRQRNESESTKQKTSLDDFTLSMMIYEYGRNDDKRISNTNQRFLYEKLKENESFLELRNYYTSIISDIHCFPTGYVSGQSYQYSFTNTWNSYRSYGGNRRHEGTDIFPEENVRGKYPIVSTTDGVVEKMGWLEQGGYRIGIRGCSGAYYYYAHLDSYAEDIKIGDPVRAGQFLGFMGDSGYGSEGTKGRFDVHLHFGIYVETPFGELSINPYWILEYLKSR
ncbi:MAG: hypothetical protein K0R21_590 [Anaerocolumna sp.]|jgi:murein DD-endopeptidase MepM/ murein hydrolase activator NlpD|nr:hypothetical protein [Anaerocolumna sp.]